MRRGLFLFLAMSMFMANAFGQSGAGVGTISGIVQDPSKAAVPGAAVVVTNDAKGLRRTIETNSQGIFTAPALIPADGYTVSVTKAGFSMYQATGITVAVGENVDLHIELALAGAETS